MLATYAFKDVTVLFNGFPLSGFSDAADAIAVERSVDAFSQLVGADGDVMAMMSSNKSGLVTLKLLQSSKSNAILDAVLKTQNAGLLSPVPFAVRDSNSLDLAIAEAAYPAGPPRLVYGPDHNEREWRLLLPSVEIFALGSI